MPSPVVDLLADLGGALGALEVPWFLFGAQAAILHGAARLTADVDVTVRLPDSVPPDLLIETLQNDRFRARLTDAAFIARSRVLPLVHLPTGLPLDIVIAGPGLEDQFFARVVEREIDHVRVPLASPEDVVVMKVLAGRPKDDEDVVAIVTAQGAALDLAYVRETLATLEAALAQSDLLPALDRALARGGGDRDA
jgi:hypothetical protein